ncbi:dTDP-4-dehydrorhamnose reductase [Bordetella pertussis]|nr:dTDP-4-dehydrorhamnose reductase [Bordetella pertussis]
MNILLLGRTGQIGDALLAHPPAWARLAALGPGTGAAACPTACGT